MKENWTIEYSTIDKGNNCILVSNYKGINEIGLYFINSNDIESYKSNNDIGVWKIKSLKQ